jgi:hypothetical protein
MGDIKDYQKKRIKEYDKVELLNSWPRNHSVIITSYRFIIYWKTAVAITKL